VERGACCLTPFVDPHFDKAQPSSLLTPVCTRTPLRNLRRLSEHRPGFEYSGTLPDEELFGPR
jgi:hypothetical protein